MASATLWIGLVTTNRPYIWTKKSVGAIVLSFDELQHWFEECPLTTTQILRPERTLAIHWRISIDKPGRWKCIQQSLPNLHERLFQICVTYVNLCWRNRYCLSRISLCYSRCFGISQLMNFPSIYLTDYYWSGNESILGHEMIPYGDDSLRERSHYRIFYWKKGIMSEVWRIFGRVPQLWLYGVFCVELEE